MSESAMTDALQEALTDAVNEEQTEQEAAPTVREYIVFMEQAPDVWKRLESVNASTPDAAIKTLQLDQTKRYAVVAGRYWQVGKPKVRQITQTTIEFE